MRTFTYTPARATPTFPADDATLTNTIPTLRWEPVAGSARYNVTVTPINGTPGGVVSATTRRRRTPRG